MKLVYRGTYRDILTHELGHIELYQSRTPGKGLAYDVTTGRRYLVDYSSQGSVMFGYLFGGESDYTGKELLKVSGANDEEVS